jgi:hypothetical protein
VHRYMPNVTAQRCATTVSNEQFESREMPCPSRLSLKPSLPICVRLRGASAWIPEYHDNMAVVSNGDLFFESDDSAVQACAGNDGDLQEFAAIHPNLNMCYCYFLW